MQVLLFYATRLPQARLETWNCGISGDSAAGGIRRYAWGIAPHKPTVATIMMGMNDVNRGLYAEGKSGEAVEKERKSAIANCLANMDKLSGLLAKDGVGIIYITPSIFDQTGSQKTDKLTGVNDALKACGEGDRKLAEKYSAGLVDFNGPMAAINNAGQAKDPAFTIVGGDRVHPGPVGHFIMAYLFLKEQGFSPTVAEMEIDAAKGSVAKQDNCEISKLATKDGVITFECLEKSLPFPVEASAEKALALVPFMDELNKETLKVANLPEGSYEILIDGQVAAKASASDLQVGINLAGIKATPQNKQAQEVLKLIGKRADIGRKLTSFAQIEHWFLHELKERSPESDKAFLVTTLAARRSAEGPSNKYVVGVIEFYQKSIQDKAAMETQFVELLAQAYAANKPKPHLYEIRPSR